MRFKRALHPGGCRPVGDEAVQQAEVPREREGFQIDQREEDRQGSPGDDKRYKIGLGKCWHGGGRWKGSRGENAVRS